MRVVINDASGLIDLRKGQLLPVFVELPYRLVIPYPIRASEILDLTAQEWRLLEDGGVEIHDLDHSEVWRAQQFKTAHGRLSANDCFCLVTAERFEDAVLLTGDQQLRRVAEGQAIESHGVLWVIDELRRLELATEHLLRFALTCWREVPSVFLPESEIRRRL